MRDGWDDEQLLGALREAMRAREEVPPGVVEAAKGAYAWHNIDAELAQLTYDSSRDESLLGQVMPPGEGTIEAQTREGVTTATTVDEIGCFSFEPIPPGPFRLRCRTARGTDVMTGWITL